MLLLDIDYAKGFERERERESNKALQSSIVKNLLGFESMLIDQLGKGSLRVVPSGGVILSRTFQLSTSEWVVISFCARHELSNHSKVQACDAQV